MRTDNLAPVQLEVVESHGVQRDDDGWEHYSYTVRLTRGDESMVAPWKQGLALTDSPDAVSVLESLILDAQGFWNAGRASYTPEAFEDYCAQYGLNPDSRRDYALYEQVGALTDDLRGLLGNEDFEAAMDGDAEEIARYLTDDEA